MSIVSYTILLLGLLVGIGAFINGHMQFKDAGPLPHMHTRLSAFRYLVVHDRRHQAQTNMIWGSILTLVDIALLSLAHPCIWAALVVYILWMGVVLLVPLRKYQLWGVSSATSGEFAPKMGDREPVWFSNGQHWFYFAALAYFRRTAPSGYHYSVRCNERILGRFTK